MHINIYEFWRQDLFAFGDEDGKGREVRLQHPVGVVCRQKDGLVYVADSYNHKVHRWPSLKLWGRAYFNRCMQIKLITPGAKTCVTLAGTGTRGKVDGVFEQAQFSEPCGVCLHPEGKLLVVADTNNHVIRVLDLHEEKVDEVSISL